MPRPAVLRGHLPGWAISLALHAAALVAQPAAADAPPAPPAAAASTESPSEPSSEVGTVDMAAARAAARAFARSEPAPSAASGTVLKAIGQEKLGRDIDRARRGDCQTKYAGMGLLAVIPLVANTITGTGCKWK